MTCGRGTIWELVQEASETLPEPFSAHALLTWVGRRRPDVAEASIRTHINYALVETRRTGPWASRTPFLTRVDRGLYRRYRPSGSGTESSLSVVARPSPPGPAPRHGDGDAARSFDARLRADLDAILEAGYRPTIFQRMLSQHGAVETAQRLLAAPQVSDGFRWLWEHRLLRLSVENAVLAPGFEGLFSDHERSVAEQRLRDAGFR